MAEEQKPFHNPFAALDKLSGISPAPPPTPPPVSAVSPTPTGHIARAVVRLERAGRGGKAVTVVSHLEVKTLDPWLKDLKSALGCGGVIEEDRIVLQGDHRERLRTVLATRGVRKITVS